MIIGILITAAVLLALTGTLWVIARPGDLIRRARIAEAQNDMLWKLVADLRIYAISQADADPVAQVVLDMISQAASGSEIERKGR